MVGKEQKLFLFRIDLALHEDKRMWFNWRSKICNSSLCEQIYKDSRKFENGIDLMMVREREGVFVLTKSKLSYKLKRKENKKKFIF